MNKKLGVLSMLLGVAMIVSAIGLIYYNRNEEEQAAAASNEVIPLVQSYIQSDDSELVESLPVASLEDVEVPGQPEQPEQTEHYVAPDIQVQVSENTYRPIDTSVVYVARINGYDYIGYLTIPALGLDLPVMANWSYGRLKTAPCRYTGLHYSDDMVIAAHNYKRHFGDIITLKPGDVVVFTDMQGLQLVYTVTLTEIIAADAIDLMVGSGHDLTLFTCTYGGANRVAVRCDRA